MSDGFLVGEYKDEVLTKNEEVHNKFINSRPYFRKRHVLMLAKRGNYL